MVAFTQGMARHAMEARRNMDVTCKTMYFTLYGDDDTRSVTERFRRELGKHLQIAFHGLEPCIVFPSSLYDTYCTKRLAEKGAHHRQQRCRESSFRNPTVLRHEIKTYDRGGWLQKF